MPTSRSLVVSLVVLVCIWAGSLPARAQLISVTRVYRVRAVDVDHSHLKVSNLKGKPAGYVIIAPDTHIYILNHEVPTFSWHLFQPGMKISVEGGMTWDLHVKAHKIYIL